MGGWLCTLSDGYSRSTIQGQQSPGSGHQGHSSYNIIDLSLPHQIAEVDYPPLGDHTYSPLVSNVIGRCLTKEPEDRSDSVQVSPTHWPHPSPTPQLGAMMADVLMKSIDHLAVTNDSLTRRLDRERQQRRK